MKNPSTYTRCTGRASFIRSWPPSFIPAGLTPPILNSPPGIHAIPSTAAEGLSELMTDGLKSRPPPFMYRTLSDGISPIEVQETAPVTLALYRSSVDPDSFLFSPQSTRKKFAANAITITLLATILFLINQINLRNNEIGLRKPVPNAPQSQAKPWNY